MTSSKPAAEIRIADRPVGRGRPVYVIAEAGSNHDGKLAQAKHLIDVAADAGADAVKFQAFKAASLYPRSAGQSEYLKDSRSIYDIIRSLEMPLEWIPDLAAHCAGKRVHFLCTPFDHESADVMAPFVPAFKIASYDMTNYPLLQHVARKGKPLIVSTGTADLEEVREMITAVRAVRDPGLVVLQCTAKYPAPLAALNVRSVATMADTLAVLTGFSDHSREPLPGPLAAVALGAVVIEKHFTLSNDLPGPDHPYAIEPPELKELIARIRQVEEALGSGAKQVHPEEQELRAFARRTIFTRRALAEGERLRRSDVTLLRRGVLPDGAHPMMFLRVMGRPARRALPAETPIRLDDVGGFELGDRELGLRFMDAKDPGWSETLPLRSDRIDLVVVIDARPCGVATLSEIDLVLGRAELTIALSGESATPQLSNRVVKLVRDYAAGTLELNEVRPVAPDDVRGS